MGTRNRSRASRCRWGVRAGFVLWACLGAAQVRAADFDYAVERFRVVGNLPGDLTDEFDDGVMDWDSPVGTVAELDGALHLSSPGVVDAAAYSILAPDIVLERSDVVAPRPFVVADQAGDFSATSAWRSLPEGPGGFYAMGLLHFLPIGVTEISSVSISNFDPATASAFGRPAGGAMTFSTVLFDIQTQTILMQDQQSFAFDPASATGLTLLRLEFDDLADELSAAVSLDGGATFARPFASRAVQLDPASPFNSNRFILLGDPATIPEPNTAVLLGLGLGLMGLRGARTRADPPPRE